MVSWMRRRLTYANVLVTALAFLVLAGTSIAQDAVSSAASLVTGKQVKNGTLTGKDVKNHTLTKKDFKGSLRGPAGPQGLQGAQGPQGEKGLQGEKGDTGAAGATNVKVHTASKAITSGSAETVDVFCDTGERAVGGGGDLSVTSAYLVDDRPGVRTAHFSGGFPPTLFFSADAPSEGQTPNAWSVTGSKVVGYSGSATVSAYVICAAP
jgi:hypothetical protein